MATVPDPARLTRSAGPPELAVQTAPLDVRPLPSGTVMVVPVARTNRRDVSGRLCSLELIARK
jgi:hypothetical protein